MANQNNYTNDDDYLLFSDEAPDKTPEDNNLPAWKIIIADDQEEIHSVTKLVLDGFSFKKRPLKILSAYSGKETKKLIQENSDIALILLDVVMETDNAGLEVIHYIREEINNNIVQIVLNTGQPGQAPEQEIISKYEINDYKSKTEFNSRKLFTSVTSSLRAYDLSNSYALVNQKLQKYQNHLEELVQERTAKLEAANKQLKLEVEVRKQAEEALRQSNEILNNILATSPIGICLVEKDILLWANEEMNSIFKFKSKNDYKGQHISILFPSKKNHEHVTQQIIKSLKAEKPADIDTSLKRNDGSVFSGNLRMSCPEDANKQAILTVTDITWRKQAEEDRQIKERLQGALEMSGSICHELNQPLQYISGSSELLIMDMTEEDPLFDTINKIKNQVDRMGHITKKLMGITRYKTRDYIDGRKIIDIDKSSKKFN